MHSGVGAKNKQCGQVAALTSNGVCWDCADQIDTRPDYAAESRWMASALDGAMQRHRGGEWASENVRERGETKMTIIYCFVNARWDTDMAAAAVCATCGAVVGEHMSSSADWARHDITRSYHQRDYEKHAKEQHGAETIEVVWLDKPGENSELRALLDKQTNAESGQQ